MDNKTTKHFFHELSEDDAKSIIEQAGILPFNKDIVETELSYKGELLNTSIIRDGETITVF